MDPLTLLTSLSSFKELKRFVPSIKTMVYMGGGVLAITQGVPLAKDLCTSHARTNSLTMELCKKVDVGAKFLEKYNITKNSE